MDETTKINLLLKDLSARLPYGVKFLRKSWNYERNQEYSVIEALEYIDKDGYINNTKMYSVEDIKPYLRPISSMTEEEKRDLLVTIVGDEGVKYFQVLSDGSIDNTDNTIQDITGFNMHWINFGIDTVTLYLDWLNAHHFDYRGLIPKGLAIEVIVKK